MFNLQVIISTTRQGRASLPIAMWFADYARQNGNNNVEVVDLAEVNLPLFDETNHPSLHQYEHIHTQSWSEIVERADAFVFVTPEYNGGTPPSLVNALDYLSQEWAYKPVAFVSYGGIAGGSRGVQMTKQIVTSLRMMPLPEAVTIPFYFQWLDKASGSFQPDGVQEKASDAMLDELLKWTAALKALRMERVEFSLGA